LKTSGKASKDIEKMMNQVQKRDGFQYYRFNVPDVPGTLDDVGRKRQRVLRKIKQATLCYLELMDVQEDLRKCAEVLVQRRRARAEMSLWETFAFGEQLEKSGGSTLGGKSTYDNPAASTQSPGIQYRCPVTNCSKPPGFGFIARQELFVHLLVDHEIPPPDPINFEKVGQILDSGHVKA
jgi:hypothetical protein